MKSKRKVLFIFASLALVLFVGTLVSTSSQAQISAYDYILRGEQYLAQGAANEAIGQFEQAIYIEPTNTRAHFGLGCAYEMRSKAARVFNYRMELFTEPDSVRKLGFPPLSEQGYQDVERAIQAYSKAALYSPPYAEGHYRQGVLHFISGRPGDAKVALERAVAQDRTAVDPAVLLAYIYLEEGNIQAATAQIDRIISATGDRLNPVILGVSAVLEYRSGRYDQAEQLLLQATSRSGAPAYLYKRLGDAMAARGLHTQALDAYRQAVQRDPESILANDAIGNIYRLSGQSAQAVQCYSAAASANPNLLRARYGLGSALLESGSYAQALQTFSELVDALPTYGSDNALLLKGIAQWKTGNANAALATVNHALGINAENRIAAIYKERIEREMGGYGVSPLGVQPKSIVAEGSKPDKPFSGIVINDGAEYTNSRTVRLAVYSDYSTVAFSNDNSTWSSWFSKPEPYGEFTWELTPGDGTKRVYVKFRGLFGIGIPGESGTIVLDSTPPVATARLESMQTGGYGGYDGRTRVVLSANDPSGIVGFWMSYDGNDWRWFDWYGSDFAISLPAGVGATPRVRFSVVDGAGNHASIEAVMTAPPSLDTQPPRIYGVQATRGPLDSAIITWTTDEPADSYVEYWAYGVPQNRVGTSMLATSHSVTLSNLRAGTTYYYRVISTDAAGNRGQSQDLTLVIQPVDTTPPVISRIEARAMGLDSVSITWTTDEPADSYVEYWAYGVPQNRVGTSMLATSHSVTLSNLRAGTTYYYRVISTDAAGNRGQSQDLTLVIQPVDTTPPVISRIEARATGLDSVSITWTTDEPADSYVEYWAYGVPQNRVGTSMLATSHSVTLSNLRAGTTYYYRVISTDAAGNRGQSQDLTLVIQPVDTTPPVISRIEAKATGLDSVSITWTTDEPADSYVEYWAYGVPQNRVGTSMLATSHSVTLSNLRAGTTYYYRVISTDAAGNRGQSQDLTLVIQPVDTTPPVISRIEAKATGLDSVSITWTTDEPADSYVEYWAYGVPQNRVGTSVLSTYHAVTLSNLRSGVTYYYTVTSTDAAGNRARSSEMSLRIQPPDTTPPTVRVQINGGAQYTKSRTVQLEITAQDDSGGPLEMRIWDDKSSYGSWRAYSDRVTWELTTGDGRRTVYVKVRDAAGNEAQAQAVITLDTEPPIIRSVQTKNIGPDSAVITWSTDENSDSWVYYGTYSPNLVMGQYDFVTSHSVALYGLSPNTDYYFRVRSADAAGNMAESSTLTFRTSQLGDRNPPTGSIAINNGAQYTRYYDVTLSIAAKDDSPGPIEMRLREGSGNWTGWMQFQQAMTYRLSPGDGNKTVYVEFRDIYGNQSRTYSASITLDTRPPKITNVRTANITANSATITWNTDEPATSTIEYGLTGTTMKDAAGDKSVSSSEASSPAGDVGARSVIITPVVPSGSLKTSHSVTLTGLRDNTTYYYQVVSKDAAGNVSVASGFSFTTGSVAPPPPIGTVNVNWAAAANGGRASASSYAPASSDGPARPASMAIDGNMKTYWEASGPITGGKTEWLEVEFSASRVINTIRTSSDVGNYPYSMTVEVEENGRWIVVGSFTKPSEYQKYMKRSGDVVSFEFQFTAMSVSKVRFVVARVSNPLNALQFYEVEAFNTGR